MRTRATGPGRLWRGTGATALDAASIASTPRSGMAAVPEDDDEVPNQPDPWGWDWQDGVTYATRGEQDPQPAVATSPPRLSPLRPPASPLRPATPPSAEGARKFVDYKMDPAPSWGGDQPEKNFKEYHRNLHLWLVEAEARLPHNLIGKRIIPS